MSLRKSKDKVFAGVCAGIAEWMGLDPFLIRAIFVIGTFFSIYWVVAYVVLVLLLPEN